MAATPKGIMIAKDVLPPIRFDKAKAYEYFVRVFEMALRGLEVRYEG